MDMNPSLDIVRDLVIICLYVVVVVLLRSPAYLPI